MSRPTIHDVADAAKVSLATVDRVLNNRGGVAAKSIQKVNDAVAETGYVRDEAAAQLSRGAAVPLTFVLPKACSAFLDQLCAGLQSERARLRAERLIFEERTSSVFDSDSVVAALQGCAHQKGGAVAVMAPDTPQVRAAVADLAVRGIHVVSLIADLPGSERSAFVGIDNAMAGRTAARFLARLMPEPAGTVQIIAGSLAARDHAERLLGFQQIMQTHYPNITVLPVVEGFDDAGRVASLTEQSLGQELTGLYALGAGNRGLVRALSAHPGPRPVTLVHDLTPTSRAALHDDLFDLVIDQDPARAVRRAITLMRDLAAGRPIAPIDGNIPLNIHIKENTP